MVCVVYGLYSMLEFKLSCEILLQLNMVDMDRWNNCGVSISEYLVHLHTSKTDHICQAQYSKLVA